MQPASFQLLIFRAVHSPNRAAHHLLIGSNCDYLRLARRFAVANLKFHAARSCSLGRRSSAIAYFYNNRIH
jgi:hypothetical protein